LIGDLFELSKLDSASITPDLEDFSLAELLQDVTQDFELEAEKAGITMEIEAVRNPAMVYADIGLMQRVLENLIRNALKFTPQNGRITIIMDPQPGHVSVAVTDTGCGISDEDLEHIFDRFYHADQGGDSDSTGLGLAIVKRILDLHGSRISVQSSPDRGTRFEFELPSQKAA
jgi:signal transduction histidine kinase